MPNEKAKSGEITVTGFNSTLTINHGLGVKPKMFVMVTTNQSPVDSYTNCYYYPIKVGGTIGMPMRNYQYTGTDTPTITENNITIHSVNNFNFAQTTYHWFAIA